MKQWFIRDKVANAAIGYRAIVDENGETICNPSPMGAENARLIVYAPIMLDALERLTHPAADDTDLEHALVVIRLVRT